LIGAGLSDVATLLERCRAGNELAWEMLVRRYQSRIYAVAYHYTRNTEEARDLAQEIFVRVYQRLDSFHGEQRFLPWLLRVARNACIDRLRRLKARAAGSAAGLEEAPELPATGPSPEESSAVEARKRLLYRAMTRLSEKNREIILLKEIQGLKFEEISVLLGLPVGTVKSRSNRARLELATHVRSLDSSFGG
jgi:RNA polymerase sigma-70 factor (ECF subfamily)